MQTHDQLIDLLTRLENLIRLGTVAEVDLSVSPPLCRVQTGGLLTDWRPWISQRAGSARTSWPPTVGEQVLLFSPSGELTAAVVLPGLYSDAHPAPDNHPTRHRTTYPDGAVIEYAPEAGALSASGVKTATVQASVSVTLNTPNTTMTGNLTVEKDLAVKGASNMTGAITAKSTITASGKLTTPAASVGGIEFGTHKHKESGGDTTGGPL